MDLMSADFLPRANTGHKGRTFNVVWSPLVSYWLASSSDDCDVRVWSTKRVGWSCTICRVSELIHNRTFLGRLYCRTYRAHQTCARVGLEPYYSSDIDQWKLGQ